MGEGWIGSLRLACARVPPVWAEPLRSEEHTSAPPLNQHTLGILTPQLPAEVGKPGDYGEWLHSRASLSVRRQGESPHHYSGRCSFCESGNLSIYSNLSSKKGQRVPGKESQARMATGGRMGLSGVHRLTRHPAAPHPDASQALPAE